MQGIIKQMLSYTQNIKSQILPKYQAISALSHWFHLEPYYKLDDSEMVFSYNRAIDDRIKSGSLACAIQLFDEMPIRDTVSWNLLISGYKRNGMTREAVELYSQMVSQGVRENPSTFSSVLSICSNSGFYLEGLQMHCRVISLGLTGNPYIGSAIVDLCMRMGLVDGGLRVLDMMPERNCAVWNLVLRGFCELGLSDEVLGSYPRIKSDGVELNELMLCYLIQGCGNGTFVHEGQQLHCHAVKAGWVETNLFVANALVDFYSACGSLSDAQQSFKVIPHEDVISWNSIVSAYAYSGMLFDTVEYFRKMQFWSKPSVRSLVALLNLCSQRKNLLVGRQVHSVVLKLGFDYTSIHVQSALIDMYGKCYEIESSVDVYEGCPVITMECCNALLTSMLYCGLVEEVVELFKFMVDERIEFNEVSLSATLKAMSWSSFASLSSCGLMHSCAIKSGLESHIVVSNSLIDLYSKLGQVENSRHIFENLLSPNVVCFTSIINGYARNGFGKECLNLLGLMIQNGLKPDKVTFLCVLMGCNHSGLVEEGRQVFELMKTLHGLEPEQRHYSCMVDLLGRAAFVDEAEELLKHSPVKDDFIMWSSLLRSCRMHKNEAVGQRVVKRLIDLDPGDMSSCIQASSFYSEIGDSKLSKHYKEIAMARKVIREIGHSFVDKCYHSLTE